MSGVDPIFAKLTAPGEPFALTERNGLRLFSNMPLDLNMLIESARRHGDKTFIVEGETRLSFDDVFRLRDALVPHLGITTRGERVAICMRNRSEWAIGFLAAIRAGGVPALVNSRGAPAELAAAVEDVSPRLSWQMPNVQRCCAMVAIRAEFWKPRTFQQRGKRGHRPPPPSQKIRPPFSSPRAPQAG